MVLGFADATATATLLLAIFTAVLAAGTVALAVITSRGNDAARRAEANQLKASHSQLRASYRPVVVPYQNSAESLRFRGGMVRVDGGPYIGPGGSGGLASMALENVGPGPALNVRGVIRGPTGRGVVRVPLEAVAAGKTGVVMFERNEGDTLDYSGSDNVWADLEFEDVAGEIYRMTLMYSASQRAYFVTKVEPPCE